MIPTSFIESIKPMLRDLPGTEGRASHDSIVFVEATLEGILGEHKSNLDKLTNLDVCRSSVSIASRLVGLPSDEDLTTLSVWISYLLILDDYMALKDQDNAIEAIIATLRREIERKFAFQRSSTGLKPVGEALDELNLSYDLEKFLALNHQRVSLFSYRISKRFFGTFLCYASILNGLFPASRDSLSTGFVRGMLVDHAADFVILVNDMASYEVERDVGETNGVSLLMAHYEVSSQVALEKIKGHTLASLEAFVLMVEYYQRSCGTDEFLRAVCNAVQTAVLWSSETRRYERTGS